jgi:hypothetical protein
MRVPVKEKKATRPNVGQYPRAEHGCEEAMDSDGQKIAKFLLCNSVQVHFSCFQTVFSARPCTSKLFSFLCTVTHLAMANRIVLVDRGLKGERKTGMSEASPLIARLVYTYAAAVVIVTFPVVPSAAAGEPREENNRWSETPR